MHVKDAFRRLDALGVTVVMLDVVQNNVDELIKSEKVASKNNPTFLLKSDDSLHQLDATILNDDFPYRFRSELTRLTTTLQVKSIKEFASCLDKMVDLDDTVILTTAQDPSLHRLLRFQSKH
jgi:hypothetical protein